MIEEGKVWHRKPTIINGEEWVGPKARVDRVRLIDMRDGTQQWSVFYASIGPGTCKGDGGGDVSAGVLAAAEQAGFRLNADRRILERLVEWSMRRELAESGAS
jgi:hypothetical protein